MKKKASWRYTPKIDRSWLDDESAKPEQPEVYSEDEGARLVETPPAARIEMEQLSERVRNMGELSVPPTLEYVPDIKAEQVVNVPANEQAFVRPVQAAAPVVTVPANEQAFTIPTQAAPQVTPPATSTFVPPTQPNYVRPNIPVQPAFKPNIPAVPPTQRIAERLAQQRSEAARPATPTVEAQPVVTAASSRPFYPESYFVPVTPTQPVAEKTERPVFEPGARFTPAESFVPTETVQPPVAPVPPEPVATKFVAAEPVIREPQAPRYAATEPTAVRFKAPEPPPFRPEIPVEPKFEKPAKVEFDPLFQPKIEEPVQSKIEEHVQPKFEEPVQQHIEQPAQPRYTDPREEAPRARFEPAVEEVKAVPRQSVPPPQAPQRPPAPPQAPREAPYQAPQQAQPKPRPEQRPAQPVHQREHRGEEQSGLTRVLNAVRAAIPVVRQLLPLLEGNLAKTVSNLLAPTHSTAMTPAVQKVDIAPVERGLVELNKQHRELREQVAAQNQGLQRVEDQLMHVRTATDRNTLEQQELIEEMQNMEKRQGRFALIILLLLLLSLAANALLYWQFRR